METCTEKVYYYEGIITIDRVWHDRVNGEPIHYETEELPVDCFAHKMDLQWKRIGYYKTIIEVDDQPDPYTVYITPFNGKTNPPILERHTFMVPTMLCTMTGLSMGYQSSPWTKYMPKNSLGTR
jgi:hypothetical protein